MFKTKFSGHKKIREGTAPECAAVATGLGRPKLANGLSQSR